MTRTSLCDLCLHYRVGATCAAYPEGIPYDFSIGRRFHLTSTGDDNGILFEPRNERAAEAFDEMNSYGTFREKTPEEERALKAFEDYITGPYPPDEKP